MQSMYYAGLDLRSSKATCSCLEGSPSSDAAGHCGSEKEERSHQRPQDCQLPAVLFSAGVLHGIHGDSRATAHAALSEFAGPAGGADEEQGQMDVWF